MKMLLAVDGSRHALQAGAVPAAHPQHGIRALL